MLERWLAWTAELPESLTSMLTAFHAPDIPAIPFAAFVGRASDPTALLHRGSNRLCRLDRNERTDANAEQAQAPLERNALEARPGRAADHSRILRRRFDRVIARHGAKIVEAYFHADGLAGVARAAQIVAEIGAQLVEDRR